MTNNEFENMAVYIKKRCGIYLGAEKKVLLEGRLQKLLYKHNLQDIAGYRQYLENDSSGEAQIELVDAITTNHTFFMREKTHFEYYYQMVLPELYHNLHQHDLRTWCAACSSGQEAYTLAMLIKDFMSVRQGGWDTTLLATDISLEILSKAKSGIYTEEEVRDVPDKWKRMYFMRHDDHYVVSEAVKKEVLFRQFNLMSEKFPFKRRFHTIFCRNVMIYFDEPTRKALIRKFYDFLEPGGYLFIGHSEVIDAHMSGLRLVIPSAYRKE